MKLTRRDLVTGAAAAAAGSALPAPPALVRTSVTPISSYVGKAPYAPMVVGERIGWISRPRDPAIADGAWFTEPVYATEEMVAESEKAAGQPPRPTCYMSAENCRYVVIETRAENWRFGSEA